MLCRRAWFGWVERLRFQQDAKIKNGDGTKVKSIENINDLIEIFEEISEDIDVNGQDRDFYEIRFMKEEIKTLLNCLKGLKTE